MNFYCTTPSPLGDLALTATDEGLTGIYLPEHMDYVQKQQGVYDKSLFWYVIKQLNAYFNKECTVFEMPILGAGTAFQKQVWQRVLQIPYGDTRSYGQIAMMLGNPKASRAVGVAVGRNPLAIIVPCHRIIGRDGKLTGYNGGLAAKKWLLQHEGFCGGKAS